MGPGFEPDYDSEFPVSCGCLDSAVTSDSDIIIKRARVGIGGIIGGTRPRPRTTTDPETGTITVEVNKPRGDVGVETPDYLVLGHELCGHALPGLKHPTDPSGQIDPSIFDPVIAIENDIRREHDPDLGQRSKF